MADIAIGRPCPICGTLVTASGSFTDKYLTGACSRCAITGEGGHVSVENPRYVVPPSDLAKENAELQAKLKKYEEADTNADLKQKLEDRQKAEDSEHPIPEAGGDVGAQPGPAIESGKHDPQLGEKYFDSTGNRGTAPFQAPATPPGWGQPIPDRPPSGPPL